MLPRYLLDERSWPSPPHRASRAHAQGGERDLEGLDVPPCSAVSSSRCSMQAWGSSSRASSVRLVASVAAWRAQPHRLCQRLSEHRGAATGCRCARLGGDRASRRLYHLGHPAGTPPLFDPEIGSDSPRIRFGCTAPRRPACGHHYTDPDLPEVRWVVGVPRSNPASKRTFPET